MSRTNSPPRLKPSSPTRCRPNEATDLPHGFVVERVLGQGATAKALLVTKDDKEFVLKVALTEDDNARLHEEAEALRTIHSEFIVAIEDELEMNGRTVLVLQKAGDKTLAALLRTRKACRAWTCSPATATTCCRRCASLERHGVVHRDIKPDNIGIRSLTKQRNQLILFDFSLARAPLDNINVGTEGYRDPFLKNRKPPRWDLAAERYSAAVTLYEMTLGARRAAAVGQRQIRSRLSPTTNWSSMPRSSTPACGMGWSSSSARHCTGNRKSGSATPTTCRRRGGRSSRRPNSGRSRRRPAKRSISASPLEQADSRHAGVGPGPVHPCPQRPGAGQRHHGA